MYAESATVDGSGLRATGRESGEISRWAEVQPSDIVLPAGGTASGTVRITVPQDAQSGEFYGVVFAEIPPPAVTEGVAVGQRVGFRIYLSVGTGTEPRTDFELPAFRPVRTDDGFPAIEIDACNTGGRAIDLSGEVSLSDGPGGVNAGPFPTPRATTVAPDHCRTLTIPLDEELPLGPWDAIAKLRSGKEERTAEARITFPKDAGGRGKKVETREVTGTLPGIIATGASVFLLLLLGGWLAWFLLKRRARRKDDEEERAG